MMAEDTFHKPVVQIAFEERNEEPNWTLIGEYLVVEAALLALLQKCMYSLMCITIEHNSEEISIPLLEKGIGSFDVLQQSLRSVALCRIDEAVRMSLLQFLHTITFMFRTRRASHDSV